MPTTSTPSPSLAAAVRALAAAAEEHDAIAPLNDDALLALDRPGVATHAWVEVDGEVVGYGIRDEHGHGQLVVDPHHRRRGIGTSLVAQLPPVDQWWSFGDRTPAHHWALAQHLVVVRELLVMERDLSTHPATEPTPPPGVVLRSLVEADVDAFLEVNAAAFAHHPEQGDLDRAGFEARRAADWYRDEDVVVAELDGRVAGFHWTKRVEPGLGEVHVLAVHPDAAGHGLGRVLLDAGLAHLADVGCDRVVLWVEGDEQKPVRLYASSNFVVRRRDLAWAPQAGGDR